MKYREEKTEKSFVAYFLEKQKIDKKNIKSIRTYGWGEKAVLRVEYAGFHRDYKPIDLSKKYLFEKYGINAENLNFNNAHHDRISCSALNIYDIGKSDFDRYSTLPNVIHANFNEDEGCGSIEFGIHNDRQSVLSYKRKLYQYFNDEN